MNTHTRNITLAAAIALAAATVSGDLLAQGKGRDKDRSQPPGQSKEHQAKHQKHKDGKALVGEKVKQNGRHKVDQNGKFSTFVETRGGKIHGVSVNHADKGDVPVTKYKSSKKMAELSAAGGIMPVNYVLAQYGGAQSLGETWIGYSYIDEYGEEVIYWFPYEMIEDPYTGAIDYVPVY